MNYILDSHTLKRIHSCQFRKLLSNSKLYQSTRFVRCVVVVVFSHFNFFFFLLFCCSFETECYRRTHIHNVDKIPNTYQDKMLSFCLLSSKKERTKHFHFYRIRFSYSLILCIQCLKYCYCHRFISDGTCLCVQFCNFFCILLIANASK